jgi:hypothetical protein
VIHPNLDDTLSGILKRFAGPNMFFYRLFMSRGIPDKTKEYL